MNMHNYSLWWKVIKLYKKAEKSEEKIFRRGYYRPDLVLFRGAGVCFENIRQIMSVYIV